ncbi:late embryogenesis abundant protein [Striga asiatica]|uniref:Late embryogenesis abundant protein n=1 Tax=Striga asiatica TaxID=4170 RepID=A0A5A7P895_STRAF|nr:late embryogenesis abundant protein [Striga asiatica]
MKPAVEAPAAANGAVKPQFLNPTRLAYRPQPPPRRRHRSGCCRSCCLWTTTAVLLVLLLAAAAGAAFYALYRPRRPSFSVGSLRLSRFNLTGATLTSAFNFSLTASNPNKKIDFYYDQISVRLYSGDVDIGDGAFPGFAHGRKNSTTLRTLISSSSDPIPAGTDLSHLRSSLRSGDLPVKIQLDTKVKVKAGKIESKKLGIRVTCDGIRVPIPRGKTTALATTSNVKCEVDPRVKIIRWTV